MGRLLNVVTPLHERTKRDCLARMNDDKVHCMQVAELYDRNYWDGDRRYGYGGYTYMEGRQTPIAQALIDQYGLTEKSSVLDIGAGKGFLLYEFSRLLPGIRVTGIDSSVHALTHAKLQLRHGRAQDPFPFGDEEFDLVVTINTLHNLHIYDLSRALLEIERVGRNAYICVESYRDRQEQFNLQCWALTCNTFMDTASWIWFYERCGYTKDYEFVYF